MTASFGSLLAAPVLAADSPISHVIDHEQFKFGWLVITNHMILLGLSAVLMMLIFPALARRYRSGSLVMTGTNNFFEALLVFVRDDIARPVLAEHTDRFIPFLWTLFFFVLFNNLLGMLPLDVLTGTFMHHGIGGTATANLYVTGALALVSFIVIQVSGIRANGVKNYLKHFLGGAPVYMAPIMLIVEFIGMLVKPFALAIRLFANMSAGHILLAVLISFVALAWRQLGPAGGIGIGIVSVLGATAIMLLELFVAFLQAYLFTFLTALFISQLVVHEHEEHHEHEHARHDEKHEAVGAGDLADHGLPADARQAGTHMAGG
jgi:F-type H+-transporting ATPase subunit a